MEKSLKRISFGTMIVIIVVLAIATIVEKCFGTPFVLDKIYGAWWFVVLWAILAVSGLAYYFFPKGKRDLRQKAIFKKVSVDLLHLSFIIILFGAFTTYMTGKRGYIHLRQGETVQNYTSEEDTVRHPLPFSVKLVLFDIEYHPDTDEPADYISFLKVDNEICKVSMNKIHKKQAYRLYQMGYDEDEMGATLLVNYDPWGITSTYAGYLLLALAMIMILFQRIGWKGVLSVAVPTLIVWFYISRINPMTPILRSPMLAAHVSVIMLAYILLLLMMILGIVGLTSKKRSEKLYRWNSKLLFPALFLLIAGIFIGAVWANISWGRYWGWDAKETWALITMLIYAFPFHKKSLPWFRKPRNYHFFCIIAFFSILMTFFGVSFFLGGIHAYL